MNPHANANMKTIRSECYSSLLQDNGAEADSVLLVKASHAEPMASVTRWHNANTCLDDRVGRIDNKPLRSSIPSRFGTS